MAKLITADWKEALKLLSNCRIEKTPHLAAPDTLLFLLKDPVGQSLLLRVISVPQVGLNGNIIVASGVFRLECFEPEGMDTFDGTHIVGGSNE